MQFFFDDGAFLPFPSLTWLQLVENDNVSQVWHSKNTPGMITQVLAFLCAAAVGYLRFKFDRPNARRDLELLLFCWFVLTPWPQRRWVRKSYVFQAFFWAMTYHIHSFHRQQRQMGAAVQREARKLERLRRYGLHRYTYENNDPGCPMKPVIFPCRTSHVRLFPKKHSFSYSYLFVGIPVGWRGYVTEILSADLKTLPWTHDPPMNCWFNVDSADYLARGENMHGLQGKLDDYLESQVSSVFQAFS